MNQDFPSQTQLQPGFESALDKHFTAMLQNSNLCVPGLVVFARRGPNLYHKAFGVSDLESGTPMRTNAMFRMFSMTSHVPYVQHDQGAHKFCSATTL
jgi:CubicO group peptidase (beta-lactamase class C family)